MDQKAKPISVECKHTKFRAQLSVHRFVEESEGSFSLELSLMCGQCQRLLKFKSLPKSGGPYVAHTDAEGITMSIPIEIVNVEAYKYKESG